MRPRRPRASSWRLAPPVPVACAPRRVELGFPEKLQRLDTPGATWRPRRAREWGSGTPAPLTQPRFHPLISPRSGEPRPSTGSPFLKDARTSDFGFVDVDEPLAVAGLDAASEPRRSLERRRGASTTNLERRRAAYVDAVRPERIRAAKERKRKANRARDVLHLYHRQHQDPLGAEGLGINGDYRPCTAPDIIHTNIIRQSPPGDQMRMSHRYWLSTKYEAPRILD